MDIKTLTDKVINNKLPSPKGISCKFIKIDGSWGIKIYEDKNERNSAVKRQGVLSEYGYAPKVSTVFDIPTTKSALYCYVTQYAEPLIVGDSNSLRCYSLCVNTLEEKYPTISTEVNTLCKEIEKIEGRVYSDNHYANFAKLDGRLVCIDFGY